MTFLENVSHCNSLICPLLKGIKQKNKIIIQILTCKKASSFFLKTYLIN